MENQVNPIVNEETNTTPPEISEEVKPKKSLLKTPSLVLALVILLCLAGFSYIYFKNESDFLKIFDNTSVKEEEYKETESEHENNAIKTEKGTIEGGLSYPGEFVPSLKVCAVDTQSKEETCIQTEEKQPTYSLTVTPGTYLVYSAMIDNTNKVYYTVCDTYPNSQEDPRCNSNYREDGSDWYQEDFICYEDAACKAAFTPLAVTVEDQQSLTLKTISQGWAIPCSYDADVCNDPNFDVWSDYIK